MIKLIVAYDQKRGIGKNGTMPWYFPNDLKWVSKITRTTSDNNKRNALLMGRKTWESIPAQRRPLYNRLNIILTKSLKIEETNDLIIASDIKDFFETKELLRDIETYFIFGGETIYQQFLELDVIDEILVTEIKKTYECDTFFPEIPKKYQIISEIVENHKGIELIKTIYKNEVSQKKN